MTDAEYRAALIAAGSLRTGVARPGVLTQDYEGRRVAARDIFYEEGRRIAAFVAGNHRADPVVREILGRALARTEAA